MSVVVVTAGERDRQIMPYTKGTPGYMVVLFPGRGLVRYRLTCLTGDVRLYVRHACICVEPHTSPRRHEECQTTETDDGAMIRGKVAVSADKEARQQMLQSLVGGVCDGTRRDAARRCDRAWCDVMWHNVVWRCMMCYDIVLI